MKGCNFAGNIKRMLYDWQIETETSGDKGI